MRAKSAFWTYYAVFVHSKIEFSLGAHSRSFLRIFLCFLRVFGLPVLTSVERISFSSIEGLELTSPFSPQSMTHLPPATSNGTRNQIRCQSRFSQKLFVKLKFVQSSLRQLAHFHDTFCEIALMCTSHLWVAGGYSASAGDETVFRAL